MNDDAWQSHVWQVDDLGGLLAVVCANARSIEAKRGMLGMLNWSGSKLLALAHRRCAALAPGRSGAPDAVHDPARDLFCLALKAELILLLYCHDRTLG